jgi:hypothetical protein
VLGRVGARVEGLFVSVGSAVFLGGLARPAVLRRVFLEAHAV